MKNLTMRINREAASALLKAVSIVYPDGTDLSGVLVNTDDEGITLQIYISYEGIVAIMDTEELGGPLDPRVK